MIVRQIALFLCLFPGFVLAGDSTASTDPDHLEQVKEAMRACSAVTEKGDWRNRELSKKLQLELGDTCVVARPDTDSFDQLNSQINKAFKVMDEDGVWKDLNDIALYRTAQSIWATHMKLIKDEKLDQKSAKALICKYAQKLCQSEVDSKIIMSAWTQFQKETAKKPIMFLSGAKQNSLLHSELQPLIQRVNNTCAITKKKYDEIKLNHSCILTFDFKNPNNAPVTPMTKGECDGILEAAYRKHKQLEHIARESIYLDMQLIAGSKLGPLLITKDLRNKMGNLEKDFVYESCMKGKGAILKQVWNDDLLKARSDFFALTVKELKNIQSNRQDNFDFTKRQTLKQYLKSNPATVAELLRKNPDPQNALALCSLIKTIQGWDQASIITDNVIIGTGVIASVALGFTGIGAPAGVLLTSTVLGTSKAAYEYLTVANEESNIRSAVATKQKKLDEGLADVQVTSDRKKEILKKATTEVAANAVGLGALKGVKLAGSLATSKAAPVAAVANSTAYNMGRVFISKAKVASGTIKRGISNYVKSLYQTNGKRLFYNTRTKVQMPTKTADYLRFHGKNLISNPFDYINNPYATLTNASWKVSTPVSMAGYYYLFERPILKLTEKQKLAKASKVLVDKADLFGGDYVWEMVESGALDPTLLSEIYSEHHESFYDWLESKEESIPRLDELAKVYKLSQAEKSQISMMARELYIEEKKKLYAAEDHITDDIKIAFHESVRQKLMTKLSGIKGLDRFDPLLMDLLSTLYYPVIKSSNFNDVILTHNLLSNRNSSTKEIMARLEEGMALGHTLYMVNDLRKNPDKISDKIVKASKILPSEFRKVANRPDMPILNPSLKVKSKPGAAPYKLEDELSRWKLISSDKRFSRVKELFLKGEVSQLQVIEHVEQYVPAYNEIFGLIESKSLNSANIEKALKNPLLENVALDLKEWRKTHSKDPSFESRKRKAVTLWLEHQAALAENRSVDLDAFKQRYLSIYQSE